MTAKLRNLLANHILMIVLLACIMLIPFGVAELLGGRLRTGDSIGVIIGTGSEMLVQAFWALSTYLLLQERWTLPVKLYAVFAAIFFVLFLRPSRSLFCSTASRNPPRMSPHWLSQHMQHYIFCCFARLENASVRLYPAQLVTLYSPSIGRCASSYSGID